MIEDLHPGLSEGEVVVQPCSPSLSLEVVGEEISYYLLVTLHSQTVSGARGHPYLRTAVEGLEEGDLQCYVDSGEAMFYQHGLGENLEGKYTWLNMKALWHKILD